MKRLLLIFMALGVYYTSNAQLVEQPCSKEKAKSFVIDNPGLKPASVVESTTKVSQSINKANRELTFVPIGESGNAFGFYGSNRSYLWADNNIGSLAFTHRMMNDPDTYGTSRIAYDVSDEKGADGSWVNNIHVYDPLGPGGQYPDAAGRYPQGAIYNPPGNTDPANAYYTYFIPTLDNTNDAWGGSGYGVNSLLEYDPSSPTQHNVTSGGDVWRTIPTTFTVTQTGEAWMAEPNLDATAEYNYLGSFVMEHGIFDEDDMDYVYDEWNFEVFENGDGINDNKIAFAPNGEIGYLLVMSNVDSDPYPYTSYHPILFITDDGGESWSEEPVRCQLGGEDGLEVVKNFLSDEVLEEVYGAGYNRDEIVYNMGFDADIAVDAYGNAHIVGIIACGTETGWYPQDGLMATFDVVYNYSLEEWSANLLYWNKTLDGDIGGSNGITQKNRPYVGSDMTGHFFFFSWLDTDIEGVTDNLTPDLYSVSYDAVADTYTEPQNVTAFTQAMWASYYGCQSHYVFSEYVNDQTEIQVTVPFVYEELDPDDVYVPVQFWYIDGWTYTFPNYWLGIDSEEQNTSMSVSQNYPNPSTGITKIDVNAKENMDLSLSISNMLGQVIYQKNYTTENNGSYEFVINTETWNKGVYFYNLSSGNESHTKKMIVK